jgi:hypothetical protein
MVAARETTLQELLEGAKQYQVPLYQRTYSWKKDQLSRLWDDILQLAEDRETSPTLTHFIGSVVLAPSPANGPVGVTEFLVVDCQQRLTTLSHLLCALRDHRAQTEDPQHRDRINEQYLINKWQAEGQIYPVTRSRYVTQVPGKPRLQLAGPVGVGSVLDRHDVDLAVLVIDPVDHAVVAAPRAVQAFHTTAVPTFSGNLDRARRAGADQLIA